MTFEQLLSQAKVNLDEKGLYLSKEDRTCSATARLLVAVRAYIDSQNEVESKQERDKAKLANENSKLAARLAEVEREKAAAFTSFVRRGLESIPEISEVQRNRLLSVNGG